MNKSRTKNGRFGKRLDGEMFGNYPVYLDAKGYKLIWLGGRDVKIHVYVWEMAHGPKPKNHEIHHIDHNKGNYSLGNLILLSNSDHRRIHAGWKMLDGEWTHKPCTTCKKILKLSSFYPRKGFTPSSRCKKCHCEITKEWAKKNPEKRREISLKHYYKQKEVKNARR